MKKLILISIILFVFTVVIVCRPHTVETKPVYVAREADVVCKDGNCQVFNVEPAHSYPAFEGLVCVIPEGSVIVEGKVIPPGWNLRREDTNESVYDLSSQYWYCK